MDREKDGGWVRKGQMEKGWMRGGEKSRGRDRDRKER